VAIPEQQPEQRHAEQPDLLAFENQRDPQSEHQADHDDHDGLTFEIIEEEQTHTGNKVHSKGIYLVPNMITTAALLCGFYSVISSTSGQYEKAIIAIFLAALFDGLDGRAARMFNAQSAFGEQYDSLSDMLSFGVAPGILVYSWALQPLGKLGLACAFIYTACAAFRLARFNVQIGVVDKRYFIGLASPLAALIVASAIWAGVDNRTVVDIGLLGWKAVYAVIAVAAGLLMISNVRYFSFKEFDSKVPFYYLLAGVIPLILIVINLPLGLLSVGLIYASSGIITTIRTRKKKPALAKKEVAG